MPRRKYTLDDYVAEDRGYDTPCWIWQGKLYDGYGRFFWRGKTTGAHRASYEERVGPIPEGLHIDHRCRVTMCINPEHLEPVTPLENYLRGENGICPLFCKRDHPLLGNSRFRKNMDGEPYRICIICTNELNVQYRNRFRNRNPKPARKVDFPNEVHILRAFSEENGYFFELRNAGRPVYQIAAIKGPGVSIVAYPWIDKSGQYHVKLRNQGTGDQNVADEIISKIAI